MKRPSSVLLSVLSLSVFIISLNTAHATSRYAGPTAKPTLHKSACQLLSQQPAGVKVSQATLVSCLFERVASLEAEVAHLKSHDPFITELKSIASISKEDATMTLNAGKKLVISGANLYLQSGSGSTSDYAGTPDFAGTFGLGNLILGYNEKSPSAGPRTGSHNIVLGSNNSYSSTGGIVGGFSNTISGKGAIVLAGEQNLASGFSSVILTGQLNKAAGYSAIALGGYSNEAAGSYSSTVGGYGNTAKVGTTVVLGGSNGTAAAPNSTVLGGSGITASQAGSVVP